MPSFEINGIPLEYTLEGQPDPAETVVLIHGELASSEFWDATVSELASKYCIVRPSRTPRQGATSESQALEIIALLEHLGIASYHLVGHSGGGLIALRSAALMPKSCLTLTLADTYAKLDAALEVKISSVLAALEAGGPSLAARVALPWLWGAYTLENSDRMTAILARAALADSETIRWSLQGVLESGDQRKWLRTLECPTLVVVGSDDNLTPIRYSHEIVEWVRSGLGVLITITGGGHNAPLERPEEWTSILAGFLSRHKEFVSGPSDWEPDEDGDDGAEFQDYGDLEALR
jgi:3-oxoadipate enol-lactonase